MNRRIINTILIFLMIVIWALVFNKVFKIYRPDTANQMDDFSEISQIEKDLSFSKDTFNLKKIEKDPFLGTVKKVRKRKVNIAKDKHKPSLKTRVQTIKKKENKKTNWPKINYFGHLKGSSSSSKLILIKIDNKLHKVREGELIDNISIRKVYRDSIKVHMNGDFKMIKKRR